MTDLYLEFNDDLILTPSGSLQLAQGWNQSRERIIRNLITNAAVDLPGGATTPPDYVFVPEYGLGLGAKVDSNPTAQDIADMNRNIRQAVFSDVNVDPGQAPTIIFQNPSPNTTEVFISVALLNNINGNNGSNGQFSLTI